MLAIAAVISASVAAQPKIHLREVCDSQSVLTLAGADLEAGRLLLALRSEQPPIPGWLIDLDTTVERASLHMRDPAEGRIGGSVAPGPVLSALPCGTACRQIEAWEDGRWTRVGPPLSVAERGTLETGYDAGGRPWAAVLETAGRPGRVRVAASRLEDRIWRPAGRAVADAVGFPAIQPSPSDPDAILVGSQRFSAAAPPAPWLRGMPQNGTGSQVMAITADAAARPPRRGSPRSPATSSWTVSRLPTGSPFTIRVLGHRLERLGQPLLSGLVRTCASRRRPSRGRASTASTPATAASCSPTTSRSTRSVSTSTSTRWPT